MMQSKQKGIALLQALFLSLILMVFLLSIHNVSRSHVQSAMLAKSRVIASMYLQTTEAEVLFALLTNPRGVKTDSANPVVAYWNFYNKAFSYRPAVDVQIEDMSSRFSAAVPESMLELLRKTAADPRQAESIVAAIKDWQDFDDTPVFGGSEQSDYQSGITVRNGPLQSVHELKFIKGMTPELLCQLMPHITIAPRSNVNFYTMPDRRLQLFLPQDELKMLTTMRDSGSLTPEGFRSLSAFTADSGENYVPSSTLRLFFTASVNDVKLARSLTVVITPRATEPLSLWDYFKTDYADSSECK
jgi:type II secretory pathway component PulK